MTARPQSPALTPAIEALVEKAVWGLWNAPSQRVIQERLTTLALAVAEAAAREERERAAKIAEDSGQGPCKPNCHMAAARAIRGGADAE